MSAARAKRRTQLVPDIEKANAAAEAAIINEYKHRGSLLAEAYADLAMDSSTDSEEELDVYGIQFQAVESRRGSPSQSGDDQAVITTTTNVKTYTKKVRKKKEADSRDGDATGNNKSGDDSESGEDGSGRETAESGPDGENVEADGENVEADEDSEAIDTNNEEQEESDQADRTSTPVSHADGKHGTNTEERFREIGQLQAIVGQRAIALKNAVHSTLKDNDPRQDVDKSYRMQMKTYTDVVERKARGVSEVVRKTLSETRKEMTQLEKEVARLETRENATQRTLEKTESENRTFVSLVAALREELREANQRTAQAIKETHDTTLQFHKCKEEMALKTLTLESNLVQKDEQMTVLRSKIEMEIRDIRLNFLEEKSMLRGLLEKKDREHNDALAARDVEVAHLASILDQQAADTCEVAGTEEVLRQKVVAANEELTQHRQDYEALIGKNTVLQKGAELWKVKARECEVITSQYASQVSELQRRSGEVMNLANERGVKIKVLQQKIQQLQMGLDSQRAHVSVQNNKARSALELENERLALRIMSLEKQVPYSSITNITRG